MAGSTLPHLLVPLAEAHERIHAQIGRGLAISDRLEAALGGLGLGADAVFEKEKAELVKWAKFTNDLLRALFDDRSIAHEFGTDDFYTLDRGIERLRKLMKWLIDRLHGLDSILQRLSLFPLAGTPGRVPAAPAPLKQQSKDIFIVHGHDEAAQHEVARFIQQLGLNPIILHEKPDRGKTLIEKVESHSDVGFAVVLLTPDDMGHPKDEPGKTKPRARQNVVFELGYFIGILGRAGVCALLKGDIEIPTDFAGVLYKPMDNAGVWKVQLAKEILHAGIDVDLKNAL